MSAHRTTRRLVRLYPRAWRERYGNELEALILESSAGRRVTWRTRADVTLSAAREHAHRLTPSGSPAPERSRAGMMLALWAWMLFVCSGATVQKVSEHWQGSVPSSRRDLPSAAFDALLASASAGGILVLAGLAALLPSAWSLLRTAHGREIRAPLVRSAAATLLALAAGVAITVWARHLTTSQRDGHDVAYAAAFAAFALLVALCLATWAATAGALVRQLEISARVLHAEAALACALAGAMFAATTATLLWWSSAASAAPAFLAAQPPDAHAHSVSSLLLGGAVAAMFIASLAAAIGARVALLASRALPPDRGDAASA
jgi:hypothetical protein